MNQLILNDIESVSTLKMLIIEINVIKTFNKDSNIITSWSDTLVLLGARSQQHIAVIISKAPPEKNNTFIFLSFPPHTQIEWRITFICWSHLEYMLHRDILLARTSESAPKVQANLSVLRDKVKSFHSDMVAAFVSRLVTYLLLKLEEIDGEINFLTYFHSNFPYQLRFSGK